MPCKNGRYQTFKEEGSDPNLLGIGSESIRLA